MKFFSEEKRKLTMQIPYILLNSVYFSQSLSWYAPPPNIWGYLKLKFPSLIDQNWRYRQNCSSSLPENWQKNLIG